MSPFLRGTGSWHQLIDIIVSGVLGPAPSGLPYVGNDRHTIVSFFQISRAVPPSCKCPPVTVKTDTNTAVYLRALTMKPFCEMAMSLLVKVNFFSVDGAL